MALPTGGVGIAPPVNPGGVRKGPTGIVVPKGAPATGGKAIGRPPALAPTAPRPSAPKPSAPKLGPRPANPSIGGHYVKMGGRWQLIHAVGPGKWAKGPVPMAGPGVPANSPLLNPGANLSGQQLYDAAKAAADAQTTALIPGLQQQIAANNRQTAGTVKLAGGYFNQLGTQAQQGVADQQGFAQALKDQLAGISGQTQSQLQGIGTDAATRLQQYTPQGEGGLSGAALSSLAAEMARQQGLAAQTAGSTAAAGARQSANLGGLAASQLGTQALAGTEAIKGIGQSGTVANQPLVSKIADLQAQRGALIGTNLTTLRQQQINNAITAQGLGLKGAAITAQNQRTQATIDAANRRNRASINAANQRNQRTIAGENQRQQKALAAAQSKAKTGTGATKPLTPYQNNSMLTMLGQAASIYGEGRQAKLSPQQILQSLTSGRSPSGKTMRPINPTIAQAAMELWTYHFLNPRTARALYNMGVRGGTFQGRPIQVGGPPAGTGQVASGVGAGVKSIGSAVGSVFGRR
jgi:hypothetical protein